MSYTNAPACTMLATQCCVCNRPLLDAISVEMGIGPECRKKYMGKGEGLSEEARKEANQIVYQLALVISGVNYENAHGTREPMDTVVTSDAAQAAHAIGGPRAVGQMLAANTPTGGHLLDKLYALGFGKLAEKLEKAWMPIRIEEKDGRIVLTTPYNPDAVAASQQIKGRQWDKANKVNTFPVTAKAAVWDLLTKFYAGMAGMGPKGAFVVTSNAVKPAAVLAGPYANLDADMARMEAEGDRAGTLRDETNKARARGMI